MTLRTIQPAQHVAGKVAGFLYLLTMVIPLLADLYLRAPLTVHGDAVQTAKNIVASERLFRLSIVEPINRNVALLAAFWRLAKCIIFALTVFTDFVALRLLSGAGYLRTFETKQLQALAGLFITARHDVGFIGAVFLGPGSSAFAYVWLKSRYIPRGLAAWGIFSAFWASWSSPVWRPLQDRPTGRRYSSSKSL